MGEDNNYPLMGCIRIYSGFKEKTAENCYTQKLLDADEKNPQPRHAIITHKRVKEMFPFMENIEYKVGIN